MEADGRYICLCFHSKGDFFRARTRSHAPLQVHSWENVLRYIGICRVALDPSNKRKFNGGRNWGSYGGNWDMNRGKGNRQNSDGQNHRSGIGYGVGRKSNVGGGR